MVGQHQHRDDGDMKCQAQEFADVLVTAAVSLDQRPDVEADGDHQDDHQHPPGDPLLRGQRPGHDGKCECPGEAGVGEVEQVGVDELPGNLGQVPDRRRDTRQQRGERDDAQNPARRRGHPVQPGPRPSHRDRHRPPGYSLITFGVTARLSAVARCTSRPGRNRVRRAPRWPPGTPVADCAGRPEGVSRAARGTPSRPLPVRPAR